MCKGNRKKEKKKRTMVCGLVDPLPPEKENDKKRIDEVETFIPSDISIDILTATKLYVNEWYGWWNVYVMKQ